MARGAPPRERIGARAARAARALRVGGDGAGSLLGKPRAGGGGGCATADDSQRRSRRRSRSRAAPAPKPLPILTWIAHHPALLSPFIEFASALAQRGVLSRRESELIALRVVWRARSPFEWGHHVLYARAAGMSDAEIARVAEQGDAALPPRELLLLRAADELFATQRFADATWAALRAEYTDAQLVEIPFLAGQYTMLSMVAEGLGVPLEDGLPPLPPLR